MNRKEAIKQIKIWYQTHLANSTSIFNEDKAICEIIELLQRGEKYEEMWEEFYLNEGDLIKVVNCIKHRYEQKYFPPGEKWLPV